MAEIICVNATFTPKQLEYWRQHGVIHPEQDKLYSIRKVIKYVNGKTGILLEEIVNPVLTVKHKVLGSVTVEPSWNLERFRTLQGDIVTKEVLENIDVNV